MDNLNSFYQRVYNTPEVVPEQKELDISQTNINSDYFKQKIQYIDSMSDIEVTNLIKSCLDQVVQGINSNDSFFGNLAMNHKFIDSFTKVMSTIPIDFQRRLSCNKLAYDYLTLGDSGDKFIKRKMFNLSLAANKQPIMQLRAIGLSEDIASNLALARYSSVSEVINVKRLNFVICNMDESIMTEQMIIWIYEKLFNRISALFEGTMTEYYTEEDEEVLGESFMNIYSTVSLAVLTILNNMSLVDIRRVLIGYCGNWSFSGKPYVRFSLRSLSNDFSRINSVVEGLLREGIIVP